MDETKIFQISLDNKPYKTKKFKLKETLKNVRKLLNLNEYYECVDGNGFIVDIDDEDNYILENLIEDKTKSKFSLNYKKYTIKVIVLINNKEEIKIECSLKDNLSNIRKILKEEIKETFNFIDKDKFCIDESEETEFTVKDIIYNGKLLIKLNKTKKKLKSQSQIKSFSKSNEKNSNNSIDLNNSNNSNNSFDLNNSNNSNDSNNETYYIIFCDNKNLGKHKFSNSTTLEEIRKKLDSLIPENSFFFDGNEKIAKNSEKYINVNKIIDETNIIFLQSDIKKEENNNSNNKIIEDKLIEKKKDLPQKEIPKEKKRYKIIINGKLYFRRFFPNEKIDVIRDELGNLMSTNARFYYQDAEIDIDDETTTTIEEIIKNDKPEIIIKDLNLEKNLDEISVSTKANDKSSFLSDSFKEIPLEKTEKLLEKNKNEPISGSTQINTIGNKKIFLYPQKPFTNEEESKYISMMVVGQTGSGKTTLLNGFINYYMGINFNDDFRYMLIKEEERVDQSHSQTSDVNIYNISSYNNHPPIKIIDTPGFGDTRGLKYDNSITEKISKKFNKEVDVLNAICFVVQSGNARLTENQRYVFTSIMKLFGKDIAENFIAMLTFSDGGEPQVLDSLKSKNSGFDIVIPKIQGQWYLKFNNSAIYSEDDNDFNLIFWKLSMDNYQQFMTKLVSLPQKSLRLSKDVLKLRKELEIIIENLSKELNVGLTRMESLRIILNKVKIENKNSNFNDFEIEVDDSNIEKIPLKPGQYTTLCHQCNYTCHETCYIKDNEQKMHCAAMSNGYCRQCPKKCKWQVHKNAGYILQYFTHKKKVTFEEMKKQYCKGKKNINELEEIKKGLVRDFMKSAKNCFELQEKVKETIDELKNISLNQVSFETSESFIENFIISEKNQRKEGWQSRVRGYEELLKKHRLLRRIYENENITTDFEEFKRKTIDSFVIDKFDDEELDKIMEDKNSKCILF